MINANDGGANVSINGGETWTDQDYPDRAVLQRLHDRARAVSRLRRAAGQQHRVRARAPAAASSTRSAAARAATSRRDPQDRDVFYAGSYGGLLTRTDVRTGERRAINVWPDNPMGFSSGDITERFQWTYPDRDRADQSRRRSTSTSQHVWKSTNEGQSWTRISPDLTRHDPSTLGPSGGPITLDQTGVETYATIFTLAPSAVDGNVIWAGSDDGMVHVTRDGGKNWQDVTPKDLPPFTRISLIEASPHAAGTAYLAGNRYQRSDRAPYVYKTADYGKTWTKIVAGLGADDIARAIREDKKRKGLLFLGTDNGISVSFDDGATWQSLQLDLPVTPVHGIEVRGRRPADRHARPVVLLDGQHRRAAADRSRRRPTSRSCCSARRTRPVRSRAAWRSTTTCSSPSRQVSIEIARRARKDDHHLHRSARRAAARGRTRGRRRRRRSGRGGGRSRCGTGAGGGQTGHEPLHLGHAVSRRPRFPGPDHVGRQHARARRRRPASTRSS